MVTVLLLIVLALMFDFLNGFHDSANSIATVVSTRVLSPRQAVVWAAFFNFVAFMFFGLHVANTIGKGIIDIAIVDKAVIFATLIGACSWDVITWYLGLPTSSSHALIGGMIGAALVKVGSGALVWSGIAKTVIFIFVSPILGFVLVLRPRQNGGRSCQPGRYPAGLTQEFLARWTKATHQLRADGVLGIVLGTAVYWTCRNSTPGKVDHLFRKGQLLSAALYSLGHGGNDAQKTMGIIASLLFSVGLLTGEFHVPLYVVLLCHASIALGTMFGGWRIVKTMGQRVAKLKPVDGFSAESSAAMTLAISSGFGIPVSTTHTITGAIMGVGAMQRLSAVRWGVAYNIIWAWILTIPAAAIISAVTYLLAGRFLASMP